MLDEDFYNNVYDIVEAIPEGKVATYGRIARALGRPQNFRAVGLAMKKAPKHRNLPCHRVVNSKGELAPHYVFGDREEQKFRLLEEGISFKDTYIIDMKKCLWHEL